MTGGGAAPGLAGLGFAVPTAYPQANLMAMQADAWGLSARHRERWARIVRSSAIERRHAVVEAAATIGLSTASRMEAFEHHAPPLAARASVAALAASGFAASEITDVVVVTCTGFAAPGIGHALVSLIGLSPDARQNQVGFMGCFGGVIGLRTACGLASADPSAVVLVVCVELCSLHLRARPDGEQLVAAGIFADGSAAAVVTGSGVERPCLGRLGLGRTRILTQASSAMTWKILDDGFAMTLAREVPPAIEAAIGAFLAEDPPRGIAVHPGGAAIIDAIERGVAGIELDRRSFPAVRGVLRDFGNMSSGSVLYVLDEYLRAGGSTPVDLVAFGPGLTIDAVRLR